MGRGLNCWHGIGNLTRDPKLRYIPSGTAVCNISIAVNESQKKDGEWKDTVQYFDITIWGKRGETVAQYLHKGSQVFVRGRIRFGEYENQRLGHTVKTTEIVADDVVFMGGKPGEGGGRRARPHEEADRPSRDEIPERDVNADPADTSKDVPREEVEEPLPTYDEDDEKRPTASAGDEGE